MRTLRVQTWQDVRHKHTLLSARSTLGMRAAQPPLAWISHQVLLCRTRTLHEQVCAPHDPHGCPLGRASNGHGRRNDRSARVRRCTTVFVRKPNPETQSLLQHMSQGTALCLLGEQHCVCVTLQSLADQLGGMGLRSAGAVTAMQLPGSSPGMQGAGGSSLGQLPGSSSGTPATGKVCGTFTGTPGLSVYGVCAQGRAGSRQEA